MTCQLAALFVGMLLGVGVGWAQDGGATPRPSAAGETPAKSSEAKTVLDFVVKDIDGKELDLAQFKGKVVVIVNVASKCGYTPQYSGLQALYAKYSEKGLVVLGFPANDFGKQEPGSEADIKKFCTSKFDVKFPMFSKVTVVGDGACDLYKHLTSKETNPEFAGPIKWNFTKFLVGRDGKVLGRFESKVDPQDEKLVAAIERAIAG